ncbi:Gnk2-homologous domain - like 10 [Theobroma cacao]|nr:Gnk2-homologous domain - like 10 [Theobroma cacao]
MDSSRPALLFFLVSIQLSALTSVQPEKLLRLCSTQSNFTMNSTYGNNLKHLFSTITSNTQIDYGFYNVSYGQNSDEVNAIGLCRGDVKPDICRSCITNATNEFTEYCPNQREAIVWYDECMLRYSNRSIFGKMQFLPAGVMANVNNVSNVNQFNQVLATLLDDLRIQAASGDSLRKFATRNATVSNSQAIYALAQCTPDLSQVECNNCLSNATESLPLWRVGARILTPSCNVRYENYIFYGPLVDMPPPTMSPASPPVDDAPLSPPADVPPPPSLVTPAPPPQQPNLATRKAAMDSSRLAVLFSLVFIRLCAFTYAEPVKLVQVCSHKSDFSLNSTYENNLNDLYLTTITSNTKIDHGFFSASYGEDSDKVNAIGLCRGDLVADICRSCINDAINDFAEYCPNQREAVAWYDECMLRYSNRSIFGKMEVEPFRSLVNVNVVNNVTNVTHFNQVLATLLDRLKTQAASGRSLRRVATGNANVSKSQTLYAMVQCTPDLSPEDCNDCLRNVTESLPRCCNGRKGARILTPSCNIRYENHLFYGPLVDMTPPTPSPAPSPSSLAVDAPSSPPVDAPSSPPVDAPAFPPVYAPAFPPVDAPASPPVDAPVLPPFDEPVLPPEDYDSPLLPPYDASSPPPPEPPAPPLQQPDHATGNGDMNSKFQALGTAVLLMILQYFIF